jgi:hypothetical protein
MEGSETSGGFQNILEESGRTPAWPHHVALGDKGSPLGRIREGLFPPLGWPTYGLVAYIKRGKGSPKGIQSRTPAPSLVAASDTPKTLTLDHRPSYHRALSLPPPMPSPSHLRHLHGIELNPRGGMP